jgi:hypothetical protein
MLLWRRRGKCAPLYIFGVLYAASVIAFFVFSRYRLPIIVVLLPTAAYTVFWLADRVRTRKWKALRTPAVVLACLFAFVYVPTYSRRAEPGDPQDLHTFQTSGRYTAASPRICRRRARIGPRCWSSGRRAKRTARRRSCCRELPSLTSTTPRR